MNIRISAFRRLSQLSCFGSEQIGELDRLGSHEYDVLSQLFSQRRSLPVYREGLWCCYDCNFYSVNIEEVKQHLLKVHQALPAEEEDDVYTH